MISKNAAAIFVLALGLIGINIELSAVIEFLSAAGVIISFLTLVVNQFNRSDIKLFFWKKD